MKILAEKLKPFSTEIAPECQRLISGMRSTGDMAKFVAGLDKMTEWCSTFGKTEMGRWMEVLNDCDAVLERAAEEDPQGSGMLGVDRDDALEGPVLSVLRFTSLLFENTFSRSIYGSIEHLIKLLDCRKVWVMVQALRLLMMISKSSRFISQYVTHDTRTRIYTKLMAILETWRAPLRTMSADQFCSENFSPTSSILSIQLRAELPGYTIDLNKPYAVSMAEMKAQFSADQSIELDDAERALAHFKLRFAYCTKNVNERFYLVMARLVAVSVFFYSRCLITEDWRLASLANDQFIEYCCEVLQKFSPAPKCQTLADAVKTEALKTLASVVFLEKAKKIQLIVDTLELKTYHGFLPTLLRTCIENLKAGRVEATGECSIPFVTSLFSLLYHIAGFEYGGNALNQSSMTSVLLLVVKQHSLSEQHISFVTRSVRIIDILTGMDITEFNTNDGTNIVIKRFTHEVDHCKAHMSQAASGDNPPIMLCNQQRSALMKSLLNFLKRAVLDVHLATQMRRIMETELPASLIHIIQNPNYYGSSLLHCAITLATNFIYQEPAQLNMLQDKGLADAIMGLIFNEKFPISRDLICALPNVCSALCLNERGLNQLKLFEDKKPLERIFRVIFSNKFLQSMRKRKTEIVETAHMLGTSFDELIRHHPTLRKEMMGTISGIIDNWLAFEAQNDGSGRRCVISWSVGKTLIEEESVALLPLGDYLTMISIILETMLTNRGVQDNIQAANEFAIALKLVTLITGAKHPNPIMLQSNYLHGLANVLRFSMANTGKMDNAFVHLVKCAISELNSYKRCETAEDANSHDRLCQLTRLCALVSILNNLMKSALHSQGTFEIRPAMLQYFGTDAEAGTLITALFDAYRVIGTDRMVISCASQQQHQQANQILEDTTKVGELLIRDGGEGREDDDTLGMDDTLMEVDDNDDENRERGPVPLYDGSTTARNEEDETNREVAQILAGEGGATTATSQSQPSGNTRQQRHGVSNAVTASPTASTATHLSSSSSIAAAAEPALMGPPPPVAAAASASSLTSATSSMPSSLLTTYQGGVGAGRGAAQASRPRHSVSSTNVATDATSSSTGAAGSDQQRGNTTSNPSLTERSTHSVAIRCLKQISELMAYIGRAFCTVSFPRYRQRGQVGAAPPMDAVTMRKHSLHITALLFDGLRRLLKVADNGNGLKPDDKATLGASHIHQSLSTLKKLLIDDMQNQALLLPNFYKSGCHHIFFGMMDQCLRPNVAKDEFNMTIQAWLAITQRLISVQMLNNYNVATKPKANGQQQQQQKPLIVVEGFEPKHYLATCQKDAFTALVSLFKALVEQCEQPQQQQSITPPVGNPTITLAADDKAREEEAFKLLEKVLECLRSLVQGMMELLEATEDRPEQAPEIPVSEIDPKKIEQLVEMGFSQSDAVDALMQHTSVPEAAEYLVSLMERTSAAAASVQRASSTAAPPAPATSTAAAVAQVAANVVEAATAAAAAALPARQPQQSNVGGMADNVRPWNSEIVAAPQPQVVENVGQMEETAAGGEQPVPGAPPSTSSTQPAAEQEVKEDNKVQPATVSESPVEMVVETATKKIPPFADLKPLIREEFQEKVDFLCREVVGVCLRLVRRNKSIALGLAGLLAVFANDPLARSWVDGEFIGRLIADLNRMLDKLTNGRAAKPLSDEDEEELMDAELVEQLASLLQLFCQLWQNFPNQKIYKRLDGSSTTTTGP